MDELCQVTDALRKENVDLRKEMVVVEGLVPLQCRGSDNGLSKLVGMSTS